MPSTKDPSPYLIALDADGTSVLSVDTSREATGWAAYFSGAVAQAGASVLLRMAYEPAPDGRVGGPALEVRELRVTVGPRLAGFASSVLRDIPVLRIEAAINQTAHRDRMARYVGAADEAEDDRPPGGAGYRTPPATPTRVDLRPLEIDDPGGYRKPDAFYQLVADLFLHRAAISSRPAHDLADANGVPVATVHRWIREAKARKILSLPSHRSAQGDERRARAPNEAR